MIKYDEMESARLLNPQADHNVRRVLDHGYVRRVDHHGTDLSIVRAARVSYNADARYHGEETDAKLIRFMLKNGHTSPFEHVVFTFEIKCPLFVVRQWHRHRTWSYNEISARYSPLPAEFYLPKPEHIGTQSKTNKQVRDIALMPQTDEQWKMWADVQIEYMDECNRASFETYENLLKAGVPRELARTVLPLATYTRFFGTIDLHNLLNGFIKQRLDPHAQPEIQIYAYAIFDLIAGCVYETAKAWTELQTGPLREALDRIHEERGSRVFF